MPISLLTTKIISAVALAVASMIFGLMPYYLVKRFVSKGIFRTARVRAFINGVICFSGGTLIGVAFLHLMPEMREKLEKMQISWVDPETLSLSDVLTCSGFFFVYIFDELMHMFIEWYNTRRERLNKEASETEIKREVEIGDNNAETGRPQAPRRTERRSHTSCFPCVCQAALSRPFHHPDSHNRPVLPPVSTAAPVSHHSTASSLHSPHEHNMILEEELVEGDTTRNPLAGLIMIIALSFHDIFEGLAVGIEHDKKGVLFLYISIAAHKYAIAFCIGMDLIMNHTRFGVLVLYMVTYSIVSPIGIMVGIIVTSTAGQKEGDIENSMDTPVTVVLQGLAGGTLIYVVCFEILQREGTDTHIKGICNVIMVLIGFLITLGIKIMFGHSHSG